MDWKVMSASEKEIARNELTLAMAGSYLQRSDTLIEVHGESRTCRTVSGLVLSPFPTPRQLSRVVLSWRPGVGGPDYVILGDFRAPTKMNLNA